MRSRNQSIRKYMQTYKVTFDQVWRCRRETDETRRDAARIRVIADRDGLKPLHAYDVLWVVGLLRNEAEFARLRASQNQIERKYANG